MKCLLKIGVLGASVLGASVLGASAWVLSPAPAASQELMAGSLKIEAAWSRATPGGARVGAGYVTITNTGAKADRLVAIDSTIAGRIEVHEMKIDGGVMRMRALTKGIELPPGKTVELKPGGNHLMIMGLTQPIIKGKPFKATLTFQNAGKVAVEFAVEGIGAMKPTGGAMMKHEGMGSGPPMDPKANAPRGSHH